ncbi:LutC/YkgG family protein [Dongia deserti]|uniref:LutC/YkgG family protein n=1 Tax=Dongia deserti TaxID=2268030 RepID=UPI002547F860|nr:lactate utilization protein [Dongia deserti]
MNRIRAGRAGPKPYPGSGPVPQRGQVGGEERKALFTRMAVQAAATVDRASSRADVPSLVKNYLSQHNLPAEARLAPDPRITELDWASQPLLNTSIGGTDGSHPVSVTGAFAGIAETGTLALTSGASSPTLLNFLPETHIAVVDAKDLTGTYEELWERLKAQYGEVMPRTLNLVTGPSRSGDIEQTILMGAHGPKRLHIILVDEP